MGTVLTYRVILPDGRAALESIIIDRESSTVLSYKYKTRLLHWPISKDPFKLDDDGRIIGVVDDEP